MTFYKKKGHNSKTLHMHLFISKWKGFCSYVLCSGSFCIPLHRSFQPCNKWIFWMLYTTFLLPCFDRILGFFVDKKVIFQRTFGLLTSKMNFTNNRLTSFRILKLRAYFEKLIGRWSGCSGWSGWSGWIGWSGWFGWIGRMGRMGRIGQIGWILWIQEFHKHLVPTYKNYTNLLLTGFTNVSR